MNEYEDACAGILQVSQSYLGEPVGRSYRKDTYFECPLCHKPKLGVSEDKRVAHCFVCGWKGNSVTLIQEIENCTVKEAITKAMEILGTPVQVTHKYEPPFIKDTISSEMEDIFLPIKHSIFLSIYYYYQKHNSRSNLWWKNHILETEVPLEMIDIIVSNPELDVVTELRRNFTDDMISHTPGFIRVNGSIQFYLNNHILFPYWEPYHRFIMGFNGRRKTNNMEHGPRYKWMIGEKKHLYFPRGVDPDSFVMITEGEKKAIVATAKGFPTIAAAGVECFDTKEMQDMDLSSRDIYICYDRDKLNSNVTRAEQRLAKRLYDKGAHPKIIDLGIPYKLDSYLAHVGRDCLRELIQDAPTWRPDVT